MSRRRWEVYETVFKHGPLSSGEAFQIMNRLSAVKNLTQSRARFTELRDMGVLYEVRERQCKITGQKVIEWDVTKNMPTRIKKKRRKQCQHCGGSGWLEINELKVPAKQISFWDDISEFSNKKK